MAEYTKKDSLYHTAYKFGWAKKWPDPAKASFPDSWGKDVINEYKVLYAQFGKN